MPSIFEANTRHADEYIRRLFDDTVDPVELWYDAGQISLAIRRVREEVIAPPEGRHVRMLEVRFRELFGGMTEHYLGVLVGGAVTKDNLKSVELALEVVENGVYFYPVGLGTLKSLFAMARSRLG